MDPLLSELGRVLSLTEEVIAWDTALDNQEPTLEEEIVTTATEDQIITIRPTTTTVTTHNQNRYKDFFQKKLSSPSPNRSQGWTLSPDQV